MVDPNSAYGFFSKLSPSVIIGRHLVRTAKITHGVARTLFINGQRGLLNLIYLSSKLVLDRGREGGTGGNLKRFKVNYIVLKLKIRCLFL